MSFREKHLWISIVAAVGVWGWYFWFLIRHVMAGRLVNDHFTGDVSLAFMGSLVLVVLVEVVLTVIATVTTTMAISSYNVAWTILRWRPCMGPRLTGGRRAGAQCESHLISVSMRCSAMMGLAMTARMPASSHRN